MGFTIRFKIKRLGWGGVGDTGRGEAGYPTVNVSSHNPQKAPRVSQKLESMNAGCFMAGTGS